MPQQSYGQMMQPQQQMSYGGGSNMQQGGYGGGMQQQGGRFGMHINIYIYRYIY